MSHFSPISPPFLPHFPLFSFPVGIFSYIFHDVLATISHFPHFPPTPHQSPPFSPISPHFPHFPHFPVACWILGYSGYGYFLRLGVVWCGVVVPRCAAPHHCSLLVVALCGAALRAALSRFQVLGGFLLPVVITWIEALVNGGKFQGHGHNPPHYSNDKAPAPPLVHWPKQEESGRATPSSPAAAPGLPPDTSTATHSGTSLTQSSSPKSPRRPKREEVPATAASPSHSPDAQSSFVPVSPPQGEPPPALVPQGHAANTHVQERPACLCLCLPAPVWSVLLGDGLHNLVDGVMIGVCGCARVRSCVSLRARACV